MRSARKHEQNINLKKYKSKYKTENIYIYKKSCEMGMPEFFNLKMEKLRQKKMRDRNAKVQVSKIIKTKICFHGTAYLTIWMGTKTKLYSTFVYFIK